MACAIIDESASAVFAVFDTVSSSPAPALESMIHGVFVVADLLRTDKLARTGVQLARTMGDFADAASRAYSSWLGAVSTKARLAHEQGDLRENVDPEVVAELVTASLLGAELISTPVSGGSDLTDRLTRLWQVLLPAIAAEASLPYFREYLKRESMRHRQPAMTI